MAIKTFDRTTTFLVTSKSFSKLLEIARKKETTASAILRGLIAEYVAKELREEESHGKGAT